MIMSESRGLAVKSLRLDFSVQLTHFFRETPGLSCLRNGHIHTIVIMNFVTVIHSCDRLMAEIYDHQHDANCGF